jgi:hypothetical protein
MYPVAKEPILSKEIVWEQALEDLEKRLESNKPALAVLAKLELAGCNRKEILRELWMFSGVPAADARAAKAAFSRRRRAILALAKRLERDANDLELAIADLPLLAGIQISNLDVGVLRSQAKLFKRLGNTTLKHLASKKVTSRDHHVVPVSKSIRKIMGKPHHGEVGDLINAIGQASDPGYKAVYTAEVVRKLIDRYGK